MIFSRKIGDVAVSLLLCGYFFIPIAPAPVHITIFSSLILSLFSKEIRTRFKLIFSEKIFRWFLIFYIVLIISSFHGSGSIELKLHYLGKYLEIGYMPLMAAICFGGRYRENSLKLFSIGMSITLIFSYLIFFGIDFGSSYNYLRLTGDIDNATVFKLQITHNFFMAFAAFLWFQLATLKANIFSKLLYFSLSVLGVINIILMVNGRTGYLTLLALGAVMVFNRVNPTRIIVGFLLGIIFVVGSYKFIPKVQLRVEQAVQEVSAWKPNVRSETSMGARMEFWHSSYQIIKSAPIFGVGIAGFEVKNLEIAAASNLMPSVNPHNQYLLFLCQLGVVGTLVFIYLNFVIWRESSKLNDFWRIWVRALLLGYAVANIFNSMLLDFAEGIFFSASLAFAFSTLLKKKNSFNQEALS